MTKQRFSLITIVGTGLLLTALWTPQGEQTAAAREAAIPKNPALSVFMREKLAASQSVLEGLVTEDFEKIQKGGEKLSLMSHAAQWQVLETDTYTAYSREFRRNADRLVTMAKKQQIDSATLGYMQLTMTCINCHKYVKKEAVTMRDDDLAEILIAKNFTVPDVSTNR